ncbi:hypothetical protein I862_00420 [endosymbiont of Acanthamoeba sp. UWC8]|uniref:phosphotransferase n=1 Tax=endosymbiont of Acanthamoeba sp. UWC8 TaxID=86106 RepID=UPI0004D1CA45|nr:phosphotransferase [endosymbiont of Acanthamoeba sp. UWC8]AIF80649.1 hypothetical protein I862_00420 [endosymbiont of Acanthamoeba sp. UWC8]
MLDEIFIKIKQLYNISNLKLIKNLGGFSSLNFQISDSSNQFVLKQYRNSTADKIKQIEKISFFLDQSDIPVKLPILNKNGSYHFVYQDTLYALYPMVEGIILHENTLSQKALHSASNILAQLHRLIPIAELNLHDANTCLVNYDEVSDEANKVLNLIANNPISEETDNITRNLIYLKLSLLNDLSAFNFNNVLQPKYLVHGDFHNENIIFSAGHQVIKLLDFEHTFIGSRTEDIFEFIHKGCCNSGFDEENINKAKHFLSHYKSVFPISNDELYIGFQYSVYQLVSSFFFEKELYTSHDISLYGLIGRDINRLSYINDHSRAIFNCIIF